MMRRTCVLAILAVTCASGQRCTTVGDGFRRHLGRVLFGSTSEVLLINDHRNKQQVQLKGCGQVEPGRSVWVTAWEDTDRCVCVANDDDLVRGQVQGRVTLSDKPVAGMDILVNGSVRSSVRTDAEGFFRFDHLPPGKYVLTPLLSGHRAKDGLEWRAYLHENRIHAQTYQLEIYGPKEQAVEFANQIRGLMVAAFDELLDRVK